MTSARAPSGVINVYAALDEVKARAGITGTGGDTGLWMTLFGVSRAIDRFCNRHFFVLSEARNFDVGDAAAIVIPDLASVTAIREDADGDRVFETTRQSNEYLLYPQNASPTKPWGRPYDRVVADPRSSRPAFATGRRALQIEGEWGFRRDVADSGADLDQSQALSATATSALTTDGTVFAAGQTILVESEQMFVREVNANTLTLARGVNGTVAVTHQGGTDINVFRFPPEVTEASILMTGRLWKRKDSPYGPTTGLQGIGAVGVAMGMDPDAHLLLSPLRRLPLGAVA